MGTHSLIVVQYSRIVEDSDIKNEQTFCKAVKLLNCCLSAEIEDKILYSLIRTVQSMLNHSIDSREWNNTLTGKIQ